MVHRPNEQDQSDGPAVLQAVQKLCSNKIQHNTITRVNIPSNFTLTSAGNHIRNISDEALKVRGDVNLVWSDIRLDSNSTTRFNTF